VNHHLTEETLRQFATHAVPAEGLPAVDDHLAECSECRERLARLGGASARLAGLRTDFLALETHLSEEDVQRYASGDLSSSERAGLDRHLSECSSCAAEVQDLKGFIAARSVRWRPRHFAAAAAVVLAILSAIAASRWFSSRVEPSIAGLETLAPETRARVEAALRAGAAEPPESLRELSDRPEALMGNAPESPFRLIAPLWTVSVTDRPRFRWEALAGSEGYEIAVLDAERGALVSEGSVAETVWTPSEPLARDRVYVWQVTARLPGASVTVPAPPSPMARFRVMDAEAADTIDRLSRTEPESHLLLGLLCALSGARSEAESHLLQVPGTDPGSETARRTLERLRRQ
jgi:hypothetical protein